MAVTDDELVAGFEACTEPNEGFHHADHVRVVWVYLGREPLLAAAQTFAQNLKAFATAHGKPNLYHETITFAYVLLIHDRIATHGRGGSWEEFAAANPDLLMWKPSLIERYYSKTRLDSDLARKAFLWPDRLFNC